MKMNWFYKNRFFKNDNEYSLIYNDNGKGYIQI